VIYIYVLNMATEVLTLAERPSPFTISGIRINEAQSRVEVTPTEPIELPQPLGTFEVDENVLAGVPSLECLIGWGYC